MAKFVLLENFTWLIDNLKGFIDPQYSYNKAGLPSLKGGERRIYRKDQHFPKYYDPNEIHVTAKTTKTVNFSGIPIECDEWTVVHDTFEDSNLKEKYKAAEHSVVITSKESLENNTAKRYYVSCTCRDFETTFKEKLIADGYTLGTSIMGTGKKKLESAICKHIYGVLMKHYADIIAAEPGAIQSAEIGNNATTKSQQNDVTNSDWLDDFEFANDFADLDSEVTDNNPVEYAKELQAIEVDAKRKYKRIKETPKEQLKRYIQKTLRYIDLRIPNKLDYYKNPRGQNLYKYHKFMLKRYPKGWVIVFTNPLMGKENQYLGLAGGELVPVMNWGSKKRPFLTGVSNIYQQFTKEELLSMIRSTKRLSIPSQQKVSKLGNTLTESLEVEETSGIKTILLDII